MPMSPEFIGLVQNNDECSHKPTANGMYVVWVNDEHVKRYAKKMLLMFIDGKWGYPGSDANYRDVVYAWLGPLPALELRE